jgi:hypothetical protein
MLLLLLLLPLLLLLLLLLLPLLLLLLLLLLPEQGTVLSGGAPTVCHPLSSFSNTLSASASNDSMLQLLHSPMVSMLSCCHTSLSTIWSSRFMRPSMKAPEWLAVSSPPAAAAPVAVLFGRTA